MPIMHLWCMLEVNVRGRSDQFMNDDSIVYEADSSLICLIMSLESPTPRTYEFPFVGQK